MTATTDYLVGKCLRMRLHFLSAEPQAASEQEGGFSAVLCDDCDASPYFLHQFYVLPVQ